MKLTSTTVMSLGTPFGSFVERWVVNDRSKSASVIPAA